MRKQRRFIVATALLVVLAVLYMSLQALPSTQTPHLTPGIAPGIAPDAPAASPRGADSSVDRDADKGNANSQSSFLSDSQSDRHRDMPAVPAARGQVAGLADFGQAPAAGAAAGVAAADAAADANVGDTGLRVMRTNRLHAFYYGWYKNPTTDGKWSHWNHQFIQHWDAKVAKKWPSGQHQPPDDVGADFFPILGPYSSADTETIRTHMAFLKRAGVGVLAVSWYPPGMADENGEPNEELIFRLFDEAAAAHLFVCLHIEPYEGRSAQTVLRDLQYLHDTFGGHAAMYRHKYAQKSPASERSDVLLFACSFGCLFVLFCFSCCLNKGDVLGCVTSLASKPHVPATETRNHGLDTSACRFGASTLPPPFVCKSGERHWCMCTIATRSMQSSGLLHCATTPAPIELRPG
eukprot:m.156659 g.156659  ORF g.156659 m.156659 type:complete len:407 (+) comp17565_c0_seq9:167-1387(+)